MRAREIARVPIETDSIGYVETLTATFDPGTDGLVQLMIDWEETRIVIPIQVRERE